MHIPIEWSCFIFICESLTHTKPHYLNGIGFNFGYNKNEIYVPLFQMVGGHVNSGYLLFKSFSTIFFILWQSICMRFIINRWIIDEFQDFSYSPWMNNWTYFLVRACKNGKFSSAIATGFSNVRHRKKIGVLSNSFFYDS